MGSSALWFDRFVPGISKVPGAGCLHLHDRRDSLNIGRRENSASPIVVFRRKAAILLFRFEDGGSMFKLLLVVYLTA